MSTSFNNSTSAFNSFPLNREITTEEFYAHYVLGKYFIYYARYEK